LPALGEFYCVACAKYFINKEVLEKHTKTKPHKRRVKLLNSEVPYGLELKEVYGMAIDNGKKEESSDAMAQEKPVPQVTTATVISITSAQPTIAQTN